MDCPLKSHILTTGLPFSLADKLQRSVSERLFDGLEVESGPAPPGGVFLPRRDSSTLHPQLRLVSSVLQVQTDGGVVLAGPRPEPPLHLDPPVRYQLCELSADAPIQQLEASSLPTIYHRR